MASARLHITVENAHNLYNADGILAGKSDPYVIVEVQGHENKKFQTQVINNDLNPVWNETGEISGFMDGDILQFTVMDKDTWPKPDQLLGKAYLTASDFYPNGLQADLALEESKTSATLAVMVAVLGCDEPIMEENNDQTLLVDIVNAQGLYNADGALAGKSDPYCICLIPEKPECKFQTPVINNSLEPEWNHTGRIEGFQAGDSLEFQVWDSDTFPKPDQLLGKVTLTAEDIAAHPEGLAGVLALQGGLQNGHELGTLEIRVQPETGVVAQMGQMEMQASPDTNAGIMVSSNTQPYPQTIVMAGPTSTYSAVRAPGKSCYSSSPVTYSSFGTPQTMTPRPQTVTYSAPQTTYSTPHTPSMSLRPSLRSQTGSICLSQPAMTYSSPSSLGMSQQQQGGQTAGKVLQVIVHPPVTVTAQEFAESNGTIISTPLPVTTMVAESTSELGIVETTERAFENVVKKKKKKSRTCC
jgi:hypothetical protein